MPSPPPPNPPSPHTPDRRRPRSATTHNADTHYTPPPVAKALVDAARDLNPSLIADLAAGHGDLLIRAETRWPNATFAATDIDASAVRHLSRLRPTWAIGRCDLRKQRSRSSSPVLTKLRRSARLLLLNPPFTCRGGTRFRVDTPAGPIHASTALSFLLLATPYLAPDGHIVSILPLGCLHNTKDAPAWQHLHSRYHVTLLATYAMGTFPRSNASTALVRLSPPAPQPTRPTSPVSIPRATPQLPVTIIRGSCPIHRPTSTTNELPLVHYTDIRDGAVILNGRRGFGDFRRVTGPAVLLPRVGRLTAGKISFLDSSQSVMLSDCVIAIKPTQPHHTSPLRTLLLNNIATLRTYYIGTGAPFITILRLKTVLHSLGVDVANP